MLGGQQKFSWVVFPFIMLARGICIGTSSPFTHIAGAVELFVDFSNRFVFVGWSPFPLTKRLSIVGTPTVSSVSATVPTFLLVTIALVS